MSEIRNLKPELLWRNFDDLTQIPRPTGHMEKVQAFLPALIVGESHLPQRGVVFRQGVFRQQQRDAVGADVVAGRKMAVLKIQGVAHAFSPSMLLVGWG